MKKKAMFFMLVFLSLTISHLHSEIFLRRIINQSKIKKVTITYPWVFNCDPLKIKSGTTCLLKFGSLKKPAIYIDKQLTEEKPLLIEIADSKYNLYYGKNKVDEPCICIKRSDGLIYRDSRSDTNKDPYLSLIITDDPTRFPQLIILDPLDLKVINPPQA